MYSLASYLRDPLMMHFSSHNKFKTILIKGFESRLIALDLSAAFDKVWHAGLLAKLQNCGVTGRLLRWFKSYFSNRFRQVSVGDQLSPITSGVPQGSVLGPFLFLIFISDIAENLENRIFSYADDCTLFSTITSPAERIHCAASLQRDLTKLASWAEKWMLKFNAQSINSIIISRSRTTNPLHPQLTFLEDQLTSSRRKYSWFSQAPIRVYFWPKTRKNSSH